MSQKRNNSQGQLIFQSSLTRYSSYIIQHWYNGLDSEGMRGIKSDNLNQLNIHRALHPNPVLTYHIYLAGKKANNWNLLMVLCLENFFALSTYLEKGLYCLWNEYIKIEQWKNPWKKLKLNLDAILSTGEAKVSAWKMGKNCQESWWISCWCLRIDYVKLSDEVNAILS